MKMMPLERNSILLKLILSEQKKILKSSVLIKDLLNPQILNFTNHSSILITLQNQGRGYTQLPKWWAND